MAKVLILFAHPAQRHSNSNVKLGRAVQSLDDVTFVDLYAEYPTFKINIDKEQSRLLEHDVIVFQYPLYWYSTPAILKEWQDLVLEYGFAYGEGGDRLTGKSFMAAVTVGGPRDAYHEEGRNHFPLRTLISPLEQTANLCHMDFIPPYVLYGALTALEDGTLDPHVEGYKRLITALRRTKLDRRAANGLDVLTADSLPITGMNDA